MGGDSRSKGRGFESRRWMDMTFFTFICCKNFNVVWKDDNKWKRGRGWPIFKNISFQDEGLIFLWVTGRAMELGRECLKLWGYERVDEIIWVKTNQLVSCLKVSLLYVSKGIPGYEEYDKVEYLENSFGPMSSSMIWPNLKELPLREMYSQCRAR